MTKENKNAERRMLADSVRRWAERTYSAVDRTASSQHTHGCPSKRWREFGVMGWLGVALPEEDGGLGGNLADACVIAEELGRALVVEPFVACGVLGAHLLADIVCGPLRQAWLPDLLEGNRRVVFAFIDMATMSGSGRTTTARLHDGQWTLHGTKALAPGLVGADACIVVARTAEHRSGLFLVDTPHELTRNHVLYDGRHAGTLVLQDSNATLLVEGLDEDIQAHTSRAIDHATVAHCAESLGAMRLVFDRTREYLLARSQFGKPIAINQVLQHRLVELYVEIEETHALCHAAAEAPGPRLVTALAARTCEVAHLVWEEAVQLHGAIGMTEEYELGAYVRRLALSTSLYGNKHQHLSRLANLSLGEIT